MEPSTDQSIPEEGPTESRRASAFVPALVLIVVGAWALMTYQNQPENPPAFWEIAAMLTAGAGVSMVAQFFIQERRPAGLIFLGGFITLTAAVVTGAGLALPGKALWPLSLVALGAALLLTRLLAKMKHLTLPALCCIVAGGVALAFTLEAMPTSLVQVTVNYWPLVLAVIAAGTLIAALRLRRSLAEDDKAPEKPPSEEAQEDISSEA